MDLCLVLLLSSTAYDRLPRKPVSCAHLRVTSSTQYANLKRTGRVKTNVFGYESLFSVFRV